MFFVAFLTPILAVILFNIAIFFVTMFVLIWHTVNTSLQIKGEMMDVKTPICLAVSVTGALFLFGLTPGVWSTDNCRVRSLSYFLKSLIIFWPTSSFLVPFSILLPLHALYLFLLQARHLKICYSIFTLCQYIKLFLLHLKHQLIIALLS